MNFCRWNVTKTENLLDHQGQTGNNLVIFIQIFSRFQKEYAAALCTLIFQAEEGRNAHSVIGCFLISQ